MTRSGPRETCVLALRLVGIYWIMRCVIDVGLSGSAIVTMIDIYLRTMGRGVPVIPEFLIFGFSGVFLIVVAPTLGRLLVLDQLAEIHWAADDQAEVERFAILLLGCVLTLASLTGLMDFTVLGPREMTLAGGNLVPSLSGFATGLLFLLASGRLHRILIRRRYRPPAASSNSIPAT